MNQNKKSPRQIQKPLSNEAAFAVLDNMLQVMHRHRDISEMLHEIHKRFPTPASILSAQRPIWEGLGMHPSNALLMSRLADIIRYLQQDSFGDHPYIARLENAAEFMVANAFGLHVERFYMLSLNGNGCLKELSLLQQGTHDCALFDLRGMLSEVVRIKPTAVILTHNHPGGTLRPSPEDIACTREALDALSVLSVPLLDHVIIADKEAVSLRDNGFVPEHIWMNQAPNNRFLKNWLKPANLNTRRPKQPKKRFNT